MSFYDLVGWVGATLVVVAYLLVSNKKVIGNNFWYQVMNLIGALGVGINAFHKQAWPSLGIQVVWAVIAVITLIQFRKSLF